MSRIYVDSSPRHALLLLRHLVPILLLLLAGRHGAWHDGVPGRASNKIYPKVRKFAFNHEKVPKVLLRTFSVIANLRIAFVSSSSTRSSGKRQPRLLPHLRLRRADGQWQKCKVTTRSDGGGASEDATIKKSQNYSPREELTYTAPAKHCKMTLELKVLHFV